MLHRRAVRVGGDWPGKLQKTIASLLCVWGCCLQATSRLIYRGGIALVPVVLGGRGQRSRQQENN